MPEEKDSKWIISKKNQFLRVPPEVFNQAIPTILTFYSPLITDKVRSKKQFKDITVHRRSNSLRLYDILLVLSTKFANRAITKDPVQTYYKSLKKDKAGNGNTSITKLIACCYFLLVKNKEQGREEFDSLLFEKEHTLDDLLVKLKNGNDDKIVGSLWQIYSTRKVSFNKARNKKQFAIVENLLEFVSDKIVLFRGLNRRYSGDWTYTRNSAVIRISLVEKTSSKHQPIHRFITIMCFEENNTLLEGAMITSTPGNKIYQNKILARRIPEHINKPTKSEIINFYDLRYYKENFQNIGSYFSSVFNSKYSHSLGGVKDEITLEESLKLEKRYKTPTKYSYYFASQVSSLNTKQYHFTQELIIRLIKYYKLQKDFSTDKPILYSIGIDEGLRVVNQEDLDYIKTNHIRQKQCIDAIRLTDHIVWVNLFDLPSISQMQATWLFYPEENTKPSIFIHKNNLLLPSLLSDPTYLDQNKIKKIEIAEDLIGDMSSEALEKTLKVIIRKLRKVKDFLAS